jgi:hypothetical protein
VARWLELLSSAAAAIVLLAALAEIASRTAIRRFGRYRVWMPGLRREIEVHPGIHPALPRRVWFEVNRDGERGSEVPRGPGVYRVLVAGSSTVECNLLDQEQAWPAVLERRLNEPDRLRGLGARHVHVGNVGKSFVDASTLAWMFPRLLPQYPRLDLVVVMVGGLEATKWFVTGSTAAAPADIQASWCFDWSPDTPHRWQFRQLASRSLAAWLWQRWMRSVERQADAGGWIITARAMRAGAREIRDTIPDPTPMLDAFERDLRCAIDRAVRHARRVLVVRPMWFRRAVVRDDEDARFWHGGAGWVQSQRVSVFYSHESWCRLMEQLDQRVIRAASAAGVEHVDPLAAIEPDFEHLYDHAHLTPAGAARLAEFVARAICKEAAASTPALDLVGAATGARPT